MGPLIQEWFGWVAAPPLPAPESYHSRSAPQLQTVPRPQLLFFLHPESILHMLTRFG
jgi:hypothetical protein